VTETGTSSRLSRADFRSVIIFVVISFTLAWLVALPLWLGDGLASPLFPIAGVAMMATPAIAALITVFFVERPQRKARALSLWPLKPARRLIGYSLLGVFVPIVLVLVALPIGALLGVYPADFANLSGFRETITAQLQALGQSELPLSLGMLILLQLVTLPAAAFINLIPALGEELGWRGWLFPKLMPLGAVPAILVSGVIWGLWHAPLILLGYNYPGVPGWLGLTAMIGMCIRFRLARCSRTCRIQRRRQHLPALRDGRRAHRHHASHRSRLERLDRPDCFGDHPPRHRTVPPPDTHTGS